ncbi:hypothetical protein RF11_09254 [Thelohanellus kitauei]|uniref:Uncharacterized protein n=1 Tax=Thelohanellus kitauei TaxID=669202 RepID=A0A0C2MKC5_THEKT|nr:hypothetical protein RF11_09254 [Thelohanellus kitauei]
MVFLYKGSMGYLSNLSTSPISPAKQDYAKNLPKTDRRRLGTTTTQTSFSRFQNLAREETSSNLKTTSSGGVTNTVNPVSHYLYFPNQTMESNYFEQLSHIYGPSNSYLPLINQNANVEKHNQQFNNNLFLNTSNVQRLDDRSWSSVPVNRVMTIPQNYYTPVISESTIYQATSSTYPTMPRQYNNFYDYLN